MEKLQIKFKKLNENASMPTFGTEYSAGADLYSAEEEIVIEVVIPEEEMGSVIGKGGIIANAIRTIVQASSYANNGKKVSNMATLPSGYFTISKKGNNYIINGGGFGHGVGMSQCGASELARRGYKYRHILGFYFQVGDK